MSRTLVGVLAGLVVLACVGVANAGIPDPDYSFAEIGPDPGMVTCPAGDGPVYQYIKVTAKRADQSPIEGIPYNSFFFTVTGGDVTITHVDVETDVNGEIRFEMTADETILPSCTVQVQIYTVVLNDSDVVNCLSFDLDGNDTVGLSDFSMFSAVYGSPAPPATAKDFDFNGTVGLADFSMFSAHYGH
jgi:hypothetical protein